MRQAVSQLASLVYRPGYFWGYVAGHSSRKRELAKQHSHAIDILQDVGADVTVAALQPGVREHRGPSVPRTNDEQCIDVVRDDGSVHMGIDEVQTRRGAPVPQQPRFDVLTLKGFRQQRVVQQIDLPHREIVRRAPLGIKGAQLVVRQRVSMMLGRTGHRRVHRLVSDACGRAIKTGHAAW
ncbi:Uncharacterised protein [Mycobacteroides abscessus subsp. massiliense]|nr:Uncharacterised protein [Mycobacteroides abscessus subsp. massiliense]